MNVMEFIQNVMDEKYGKLAAFAMVMNAALLVTIAIYAIVYLAFHFGVWFLLFTPVVFSVFYPVYVYWKVNRKKVS